ncbi:hypothetical protein AKO1_012987 [Acrasis kona]|uniref:ABC transporter domain-containing protein n=1 Tax=Acrasis kona TaxID=1008807 RepID=A0AAW2YZU1_9EUKA
MNYPLRCDSSNTNSNMTCWKYGLSAPIPCPDGHICTSPSYPPLPMAPGMYVSLPSYQPTPCPIGSYCPIARSRNDLLSSQNDTLFCPAQVVCSHPAIMTPVACQCSITNCSYCPTNTSVEIPCPAGSRCGPTHYIETCNIREYCPEGSTVWTKKLCPGGFYCPTPKVRIECPEGYYCRNGSTEPQKCFFAYCPPGSRTLNNFVGPLLMAFIVVVLVLLYKLYEVLLDKYRRYKIKKVVGGSIQLIGHETDENKFFMDIGFQDLTLTVKTGGGEKMILDHLNGEIKHGTLTAVMGLSGSGKSSFMTTLVGRANYGTTTGTVFINNKIDSLSKYDRMVGFVPQEDIMLREMNVRQILEFSARTRLGFGTKGSEVEQVVNKVIDQLMLKEIQYSVIGDEKKRGISGGQRKRVNIGMEMVANPKVLFLDEPTSGLDSTASQQVCQAMHQIAETGITVITVIHQPRKEIFDMFHNIMLIGKGGRLVYLGPRKDAQAYFESLGFVLPPNINPADWMMDVMSGQADCTKDPDFRENPDKLCLWWRERQGEIGLSNQSEIEGMDQLLKQEKKKRITHYPRQLLYCIIRCFTQLWNNFYGFILDNVLIAVSAMFLGIIFFGEELVGPPDESFAKQCPEGMKELCRLPLDDPVLLQSAYMPLSFALAGVMISLSHFGKEIVVFKRESLGGLNIFCYFIAKNLSHILHLILNPMVYLLVFFALSEPRGSLLVYYVYTLPLFFTSIGFGYFISVAVREDLTQLAAVISVLVSMLVAGMRPTLPKWAERTPPLSWLPHLSFMRYAQELLYLYELKQYNKVYGEENLAHSLKRLGYSYNNEVMCALVLTAFGFGFRILAFFFLYTHKENTYYQSFVMWLSNWKTHVINVLKLFKRLLTRKPKTTSYMEMDNNLKDNLLGPIELNSTPV